MRQVRVLVATRTKKQAVELLVAARVISSRDRFTYYWTATGNAVEIEVAMANLETVLVGDNMFRSETWTAVKTKDTLADVQRRPAAANP